MGRPVKHIDIPDSDVDELTDMLDDPRLTDRMKIRFRMVLLKADYLSHSAIADQLGSNRQSVIKWVKRYEDGGIPALQDDRAGKGGPLGRRRVRRSLKGTAEKLLAAQRSLTHEDIERLVLTQLREEPDDEPGQPYATHSKVKVSLLSVLADVVKSKASGDSIEDLLSQL
jgi:biotin operon repressor